MNGRIHSLESCGTVDGPGIRYVVFVQGCPMRCLYCHNPDTWKTDGGREVSTDEILEEFEHKRSFYKNGGITVTGGEPLLQMDFLTELFQKAKARSIHTCIDTSGVVFHDTDAAWLEKLDTLLKVTDLILLDIKHIDDEEHKKLTSHSNKNILAFARYLDKKGIDVWIRHVVVPTITYNEHYLRETGRFIGSLGNVHTVEVLPYHTMGVGKYKNLGMDYPLKGIEPLDKEELAQAKKWLVDGIREAKNGKSC